MDVISFNLLKFKPNQLLLYFFTKLILSVNDQVTTTVELCVKRSKHAVGIPFPDPSFHFIQGH